MNGFNTHSTYPFPDAYSIFIRYNSFERILNIHSNIHIFKYPFEYSGTLFSQQSVAKPLISSVLYTLQYSCIGSIFTVLDPIFASDCYPLISHTSFWNSCTIVSLRWISIFTYIAAGLKVRHFIGQVTVRVKAIIIATVQYSYREYYTFDFAIFQYSISFRFSYIRIFSIINIRYS